MATATYLRHGRGQSINSIDAKVSGRFPASYWAKEIGKGVTAADIITALGKGEWHHTGKFASKTYFFDAEEFDAEGMELIFKARDARKAALTPKGSTYKITWKAFYGTGRYKSVVEESFEGSATIKGDWISFEFEGKTIRKNITGNWIKVVEVKQ